MDSRFKFEDFFFPDRFVTSFDTRENGAKQFNNGMEIGKEANEIHIAVNDVWSAKTKHFSSIQSYEKLGYHSDTCDLLKGFISSGCTIIIHRMENGKLVSRELK